MKRSVVVELVDITKKYGRRQLFSNISGRVGPGECLAVTGSNGSGKSTLLKVVAGLVRPSAGRVAITAGGHAVSDDERLTYIGMVSPELILYNAMTGYENLRFLTRARGLNLGAEDMLKAIDAVGLAGRHNDLVSTYSTGMRQRLKFAVITAISPPVWLLDEPSSNLDADGKRMVADLISQALERRAAVVLATNEAEEARHAGQKIALV
jgi:heme exporter protein A